MKPDPTNGVNEIYQSPFDAPRDCFGVEWLLTGLGGWVLHGHGRLQWNADATVIADLIRRSLKHVKALGKSRHFAEIFARTKVKQRA